MPEEGEDGSKKKKKTKATGWRKDTPRLMSQVLRAHPEIPISDKERPAMIDKVIAYMAERQKVVPDERRESVGLRTLCGGYVS